MSRVENIEGQVKDLNSEELREFSDWFASFDAEVWDAQIEADARNGKLRSLAERAMALSLYSRNEEPEYRNKAFPAMIRD